MLGSEGEAWPQPSPKAREGDRMGVEAKVSADARLGEGIALALPLPLGLGLGLFGVDMILACCVTRSNLASVRLSVELGGFR